MARHRMVAPINSIKHYVHRTNVNIASAAIQNNEVVSAVSVASVGANAQEVEEGAVVKAVYIEMWLLASGATGSATQFVLTVEKKLAGAPNMTAAQILSLGSYPNKKNILYTTQGVLGNFVDGSPAVPIIRAWIKIPKGKQRFGLTDKLMLNITTVGTTMNVCGIFIFKEYK